MTKFYNDDTQITIGIIFDMVGVAVLSCEEAFLHARASKKIKGSKEAIRT